MGFSKFIGYDREGAIKELPTTLNKGRLNTFGVVMAALGFNAPAWVAASSMSILYSISGKASPLAILIAYFFPMLVLALSMVYLTRQAPSAAGVFTFSEKFIHPHAATILGWSYVICCATVTPMTAVIGTEYIQALIPGLQGVFAAKLIGTVLILVFLLVCLRGIDITAKVAGTFLIFEILVVAGLGLCGILNPQVEHLSFSSLYSIKEAGGWSVLGPAVLFGVWMLANFDSSINLIEEAKVPVRTVQRSIILVVTSAFIIYSIAAIGWQYAIPVEKLASIVESGDGGPIAAVANVYLPPALSWVALFVVITSACAGLQISLTSGSRAAYRMSIEGHLPNVFSTINKRKVPWLVNILICLYAIILVWLKPLSQLQWYYDVVTITLVFSYLAILVSFIRAMFMHKSIGVALLASIFPVLAMGVLGYIGYTAGAVPVNPDDLYNAWYLGAGIIITGVFWVFYGKRNGKRNTIDLKISQNVK
ncbi:APC family permease [Neobacillus sp. NRS-1170]|uniref:APC family permease n=1 Tax=Neobacillus sp. NRS-1170 TaxID=3233898 RepID=UPI003D2E01AF